ncbi:MAG: DUF937 domain-containing protein [Alcaligenaceae bacterium]|nr:DUF937 domain-containing protein [Alcaligenaceae bacterium]
MHFNAILAQMGGLQSIANDLGISEAQAAQGAEALAPALLGGFKKQARSSGLDGLGGLLGQFGSSLLTEVLQPQRTDPAHGNDLLGAVFGSKDVSRTVAANAAEKSGLDTSVLKKMLPLLAMLVAGYLSKQREGTALAEQATPMGGLGGLLGGLLQGGTGSTGSSGQGLLSMLDMNGDGNALDDILGMAGKAMQK